MIRSLARKLGLTAASSEDVKGHVDYPPQGHTLPRDIVSVRGWSAGVSTPVTDVRVRVEEVREWHASYGEPRIDVKGAHPDLIDAENSGWSAEIDLRAVVGEEIELVVDVVLEGGETVRLESRRVQLEAQASTPRSQKRESLPEMAERLRFSPLADAASNLLVRRVRSVEGWCRAHDERYTTVLPARTISVRSPRFFNEGLTDADRGFVGDGELTLPAVVLAQLHHVGVTGRASHLITESALLYDEHVDADGHLALRTPSVKCIRGGRAWLPRPALKPPLAGPFIHFCCEYSANYYHWLVECLPRLSVIESFENLAAVPLLVDAGLPPNLLEALRMQVGDRPIVEVGADETIEVDTLYFPSKLSDVYDNYGYPKRAADCPIAPESMAWLRRAYLSHVADRRPARKLFIRRDRPGYRELRNNDALQAMLEAEGFETVRPENMTFREQLETFARACVIVAQASAGLTNLVFAPEGCTVVALTVPSSPNFYAFSLLADACGVDLVYLLGDAIKGSNAYEVHEDFTVPVDLVREAVRSAATAPA